MTDKVQEDHSKRVAAEPIRPHPTMPHYYGEDENRSAFVDELFDSTARHYDRINRLISFGTDRAYRHRTLLRAGLRPGMRMLDVACGTGMIAGPAKQIVGPTGQVIGLDPSSGMLREAVRLGRLGSAVRSRAEQLPLQDNSFEFLTMGYALRHISDLRQTLCEYRRVLESGGRLLILEISTPSSPIYYNLIRCYLKFVVPSIAKLSTRNRDAETLMDYFWDTVDQCVDEETVVRTMRQTGFRNVFCETKHGIFSEYQAMKA